MPEYPPTGATNGAQFKMKKLTLCGSIHSEPQLEAAWVVGQYFFQLRPKEDVFFSLNINRQGATCINSAYEPKSCTFFFLHIKLIIKRCYEMSTHALEVICA